MGSYKVLRVGMLTEVHQLDPRSAQDVDSMFVLRQVLDTPFELVPGSGELKPRLLTGALEAAGGDGLTYRGTVREDVRFSDGEPLTPEHVAHCLRETSLLRGQVDVTIEGRSLLFRLRRPNPRFDLLLSHGECSIYRRSGGHLVGTGAFQLLPDSRPGRLHLQRNPHHQPAPALDEVIFQTYPPGPDGRPTSLVRALEAGLVDFCNVLPRDEISDLTGLRKSFSPGLSTAFLSLNVSRPALADVRLRTAIALSIQRRAVARTCYANALAFAAASLLPRELADADDGLIYDPAQARALLEAAGGAPKQPLTALRIWGPRPYLPNPEGAARSLTEQLAAVGIQVEWTVPASSRDFFEATIAGRHDLTLTGWTADTPDPCDFLEAVLASDRVPSRANLTVSANHGRFRDAEMDLALARYRTERTAEALRRILELIHRHAPLVPLIYGANAAVLSFKVLGFVPSSLGVFSLGGLDLKS